MIPPTPPIPMTMADETDFLVCVTVLLAWKASTEGTLAVGSQEQYRAYEIVSIDSQSPLKANTCQDDWTDLELP
jgi:hypothetical protein